MICPPLTVELGGLLLPVQASITETTTENATDTVTLDGTLYTDFINIRRSWAIVFIPMSLTTYQAIYNVFFSQYQNADYLEFICSALGIDTFVRVTISDKAYDNNGTLVNGLTLTLSEQYAIS